MTMFSSIKFTGADVVKVIGGLIFFGSMWVDLRTERMKNEKEHEFFQYQIDELKNKKKSEFTKPEPVRLVTEKI